MQQVQLARSETNARSLAATWKLSILGVTPGQVTV